MEVAYCGICHSDLSLIDGSFDAYPGLREITQGHEVAGTIAALGPGTDPWKVGDRVIPAAGKPCFSCEACRRGVYAECTQTRLMAFTYDGGWARYTVALAGGLTAVPDEVPLEQAALLADAVATPYSAVTRTADVRIGEAVGVWGVGGIGTHVVQIARLVGAHPIIAVDTDTEVLDRAVRLGADAAFDAADPRLQERITETNGGRLLDVAFDAAGYSASGEQALRMLRRGGRMIGVGMSAQRLDLGSTVEFNQVAKQVRGHMGYTVADIATLVRLLAAGRLDLSESVSEIVGLEDIEEGIRRLRDREGHPIRILVQPQPDSSSAEGRTRWRRS